MRLEAAKAILQAVPAHAPDDFFLRSYNMNLYRGCCHGCIYCDARSVCYRLSEPGRVRAKANALEILRGELRAKKRPGIVGMGGMSDGYNPFERKQKLTRGALSLLVQYGFGIGITTKSPLVARDIDLLCAMREDAPVYVTFSITAADDALSRIIEPGVAPASERFAAMRALADAGILTGMWLNPVLPYLTDGGENIQSLLETAMDNGARYALTHYGMTLREGNREYFYAALDRHFPGMKARYAKAYGLSYQIPIPNAYAIQALFKTETARFGLASTFAETNRLIEKSGGFTQQSLL